MLRIFTRLALALGACVFAVAVPRGGPRAQDLGPALDLRPGQEVTFPVTIADGRVTLGKARASRPGTAHPREGEITVSVVKQGLSPYAELTAAENTPAPVDFVATGLVGDIKIDEVRLCGRLGAPSSTRIYSGSWRISLNRFAVGPEEGCP